MRPLTAHSPGKLLRSISHAVVRRRLAIGWTRAELAARSGVAPDTLKRFEQTGQVSLERLLKVALALGALHEFGALFPEPEPSSLAELEALEAGRSRRRVRRRGTTTTRAPLASTVPRTDPDATP